MKKIYWKKNINDIFGGFYLLDEPQTNEYTEITLEYRNELINKNNTGMSIIDNGYGYPIAVKNISETDRKEIIIRRIKELTRFLNNSDYKIVKCYEATMLNKPLPYDLQALVLERDTWREEINNLEFELAGL